MRKVASVAVLAVASAAFVIAVAGAVWAQTATPTLTPAPTSVTCADFKTQAEAQAFFTSHGGSKANNVDNLDPNRNGIACEGLPGTPTTTAAPQVVATPTPAPASTPLPNNGVFSDIMAMSGLSMLEVGVGLSLLSERIRSGGKRAPLYVWRALARASRQGRSEVALADDVYIVRKPTAQAPVREPATPAATPAPPAPEPRVARPPRLVLTPPIDGSAHAGEPTTDEFAVALAFDEDARSDWPYFTPPDAS